MTPGTKIMVDLPFAKRPFSAVISEEKSPLAHCFRIVVDKPSRATVSAKVVNVFKDYCTAV